MILEAQVIVQNPEYVEMTQFITVSLALFAFLVGGFLYILGRLNESISSVTNKREDEDRALWKEVNQIKSQRGDDAIEITKTLGELNTTLGKINVTLQHMNDSLVAVKEDVDDLKNKKS